MVGNVLGILSALTSAILWGGGDFSGGFASRSKNQYQVLALSSLSGIFLLVAAALIWKETFPSIHGIFWASLAGIAGAIGISSLYHALATGKSVIAAPTSALLGASLPVCFSFLKNGAPEIFQVFGIILAFVAIWLVASSANQQENTWQQGFISACVAGISFGAFFICISQVESGKVFTPLILSRSVMFLASLLFLRVKHQPFPKINTAPVAALAGVLDAGGNIFFLIARQFTRLDIAVILSSLYPAVTVIFSMILLKEKTSGLQKAGLFLCLVAIILISQ